VVATTPGLAEALAGDWRKAARFYARLGINEELMLRGVTAEAAGRDSRFICVETDRRGTDGRGGKSGMDISA